MGNWLTSTSRVLIFADTGLGKTLVAMAVGMAAAGGKDFLHWQGVRPAKVLYIDGEMSRRLFKQRLADEAQRLGVAPETFFALNREDVPDLQPLNTVVGQKQIEDIIRTYCGGKVDLVVFDNIMALIAGDQKDEMGWRMTLPWVRRLTKFAIGQIWIHHTGHDTTHSYGTKTREWQMDTVIGLEKIEHPGTDVSFQLSFQKARERTPETRDDFAPARIALVGNQWIGEATAKVQHVSPKAEKFFEALGLACDQQMYSCPAATIEAWREICFSQSLLDRQKLDSARTLFNRHKLELITANWIACNETHAWSLIPVSRSPMF